jgi:hypothetical protein
MSNSFVAFFDILGFKNIVDNNSHDDLLEIYNDSLPASLELMDKYFPIIYSHVTPSAEQSAISIKAFLISDSLILIQNEFTERGLTYIIAQSQILLGCCLFDGIPLRGAISYGEVSVQSTKWGNIIVGKGLTNAYLLESQQDWSGGIVDKKCFDSFVTNSSNLLTKRLLAVQKPVPLICNYDVPFKNGSFENHFVLDWTNFPSIKSQTDILAAFTKHNKRVDADSIRRKIDSTLKFYNDRNFANNRLNG